MRTVKVRILPPQPIFPVKMIGLRICLPMNAIVAGCDVEQPTFVSICGNSSGPAGLVGWVSHVRPQRVTTEGTNRRNALPHDDL